MNDNQILDSLCTRLAGKPAAACDWRDLLRVRDRVEAALNGAVNAAQNPASTSPVGHQLERDCTGSKAASEDGHPRSDLPAPDVGGGALDAGPRPCSRSVADHIAPLTPTTTKETYR